MAVDDSTVIDAVSTDRRSGRVKLHLFDSRNWRQVGEHLLALQAKLNTYLDFVQSGQILETHPKAKRRGVSIIVVFRCPLPPTVTRFLNLARETLRGTGMRLLWRVSPD